MLRFIALSVGVVLCATAVSAEDVHLDKPLVYHDKSRDQTTLYIRVPTSNPTVGATVLVTFSGFFASAGGTGRADAIGVKSPRHNLDLKNAYLQNGYRELEVQGDDIEGFYIGLPDGLFEEAMLQRDGIELSLRGTERVDLSLSSSQVDEIVVYALENAPDWYYDDQGETDAGEPTTPDDPEPDPEQSMPPGKW